MTRTRARFIGLVAFSINQLTFLFETKSRVASTAHPDFGLLAQATHFPCSSSRFARLNYSTMNDVSAKAGSSTQTLHKPRQSSRGGNPSNRGHGFGHGHSKNKTWVSGQAHSTAPAEGKWERGRGSGTYRGRGNRVLRLTNGRGGHHSNTTSNAPSTCVTEDEDADVSEADADATQPSASSSTPSNGQPKTWEEVCALLYSSTTKS